MKRWQKVAVWTGGVLVVLLAFIAFVLPGIIRSQTEKRVAAAIGRTLTIGRISLNPITWRAELRQVRLSEKGSSATFVGFSSVSLRISPSSIWRRAPIVSEAAITAPYIHLVRTGPNSFNFSDLLEKKPERPSAEPARFSLNNIIISNGRLEFDDRAVSVPTRHTVAKLLLQVPFISNIPYLADRYVAPELSALVNGAPFRFTGKLKPFAKGMEASIDIRLQSVDIPFYAAYFPAELPVRVASGSLTTDLEVTHRLTEGNKPDLTLAGTAKVAQLALTEKGGTPLVGWQELAVEIGKAGLMTNSYDLASVTLERPELTVSRDRQGGWNFQRLARPAAGIDTKPATTGEEQPKADKPGSPTQVSIKELRVNGGMVHFSDAVPPGGFSGEVKPLDLSVTGFNTAPAHTAGFTLALLTGRQEKLRVTGGLTMAPLAATARLALSGLVAEAYHPYLATALREPVSGRLDAAADLAWSADGGLTLDKGALTGRTLAIPFGNEDGIRLPLVELSGATYRQTENSAVVERLAVKGGTVRLSRDESGGLSPQRLLVAAPATAQPARSAAKTKAPPAKAGAAVPPLRWQLRSVAISGLEASFVDRFVEEAPRFDLHKLQLTAGPVTGPTIAPIPFNLATGYGSQGRLAVKGRLTPTPFALRADCSVARFPLLDADPYLPDGVNVVLADGKLDAGLALDLATKPAGLAGSFAGSIGIRDFYTMDGEGSEDLLKWESLQLDGLKGSLQPFSLALAGVALNNFYARVIIDQNGRLNLQQLYQPPAPAVPPAAPATAAAAGAPAAVPSPRPAGKTVRIDAVTLQGGVLNFTDRHLSREFATTMVNLGGRVSGLSSEPGQLADVDLRGNLENHSPLKITGTVNPLRDDLFLDLTVSFMDIELSPMTPYAGTYLGYTVDRGKLSLDLKYHIDQKKLSAENKVFMDQFTFGEKVASDKATNLPVRLAVALLKDRRGEIRLDLPVAGRTDDPKFSIWGVVWQMLKNLLVKAATSPFSLLSGMFGGGDDFSSIAFAPGVSRLAPPEEAKLRSLAKAVQDRPGIKLEVTGFVDRERDAEGYRQESLLRKMRTEKFLSTAKEKGAVTGQSVDTVVIPAEEQSLWLKTVYEKEKFPKPRTIIGTLKSLPDAEMRKLVLANTVVGDTQLAALARDRAVTVRNFLVEEGKLPPERIFEKRGDIFAQPQTEGASPSRVEFGVVAQ
jgi:uncharacterized protein involved in outer membrane biogenesis